MNSIHRLGLVISGAAAALTVGGALVVQGYTTALQTAQTAQVTPQIASDAPTDGPTATPTMDPQIIYVLPQATPPVVKVKQKAPARVVPAATQPPAVAPTATPWNGEDSGGDD